MKLTIRMRHLVVTPETSSELRHRILRAFERVLPWIRAVDVAIADLNGPRGGADKQCRLRVRGTSIPTIVIEHVGVDTISTVALAAARAEQAVLRKRARRRSFAPMFAS